MMRGHKRRSRLMPSMLRKHFGYWPQFFLTTTMSEPCGSHLVLWRVGN